jgi:hypothetical protein
MEPGGPEQDAAGRTLTNAAQTFLRTMAEFDNG